MKLRPKLESSFKFLALLKLFLSLFVSFISFTFLGKFIQLRMGGWEEAVHASSPWGAGTPPSQQGM